MTRSTEKPQPSEKRRWLAILLTTALLITTYVVFLYSLVVASGDESVFAGGLLGIGLGLVPGVFFVAAFVSQNRAVVRSTLKATGLWGIFVLILFFDLPTALVAGFGAGGIVAFRLGEENSYKARAIAIGLCVAYTFVLLRLTPQIGLFAGAPLPFVAIGLADMYTERAAVEAG